MHQILLDDFGLMPCVSRTTSIGQRFGRLVVLAFGKKGRRVVHAVCRCDCGNLTASAITNLKRGRARSCGCYREERHAELFRAIKTTHGLSGTRLYSVWRGMMTRCYDATHAHYDSYGGRGIQVCQRWRDPSTFSEDLSASYKPGLTLDRIDNNGDYEPSNCRWATHVEQCQNKRTNVRVTFNGVSHTLSEWARIAGVNPTTIKRRAKRGAPLF